MLLPCEQLVLCRDEPDARVCFSGPRCALIKPNMRACLRGFVSCIWSKGSVTEHKRDAVELRAGSTFSFVDSRTVTFFLVARDDAAPRGPRPQFRAYLCRAREPLVSMQMQCRSDHRTATVSVQFNLLPRQGRERRQRQRHRAGGDQFHLHEQRAHVNDMGMVWE